MVKGIKRSEQVEIVHPNAGGLDIGSREIWVCVPPDRDVESVKMFGVKIGVEIPKIRFMCTFDEG